MKYTIAVLLLICGFCFGFFFGEQEKEIITEYVIVYEEVIREVVKEVPIELRQFESWHELSVWQARNYIKDAKPDECVDDALELQRRALEDGYLMSTELWGDGLREGHMICSAVIQDKIYFLEPTNTFSWKAGVKK